MFIEELFILIEAEYSYRLKKKIVPIKLQPQYRPDGWLGALLGNKLEVNFTRPVEFAQSVHNLLKELKLNMALGKFFYFSSIAK